MKRPFYADGLRFECQGSGRCCTSRGEYGYVYLTLADRKRFAQYFKVSTAEFTRTYCEKTDGHIHLKNPTQNCRFLADKRCSVYEGRPTQCRTWPFWPENMTPKAWNIEVASYCPGVGKGPVRSREEIEANMRAQAGRNLDP